VAASKPKCDGINKRGGPCAAPVMDDARWCFFHSPETRTEAAEARRLGGLRRRREGAVAGAYDFEGIATVGQIRRVLEIAISDALGLENSISRSRTLGSLAMTALKALEVGDLEARLEALEAAVRPRTEARRRG
jgi:hypothetical protein